MCGIIGYAGSRQAAPILLSALKKLEYRGYDSAGIAVINESEIQVRKTRGRLQLLSNMTRDGQDVQGTVGIGHTRWATHGEPSDRNSHPHMSSNGRYAVVHNGIIENYQVLKEMLIGQGFSFQSETDSEVISNLMEYVHEGDMLSSLLRAAQLLKGSFALGVLSLDEPDTIAAIRRDSPLIVGRGERENYIVSDIPAILNLTRDVYYMEEDEIALITGETIRFFDSFGNPVEKDVSHIDWDISAAEKGGYEHFMMKEIMEQPNVLREIVNNRVTPERFNLDELKLDPAWLKEMKMVHIVACGSAYHAGRLGKNLLESKLGIPVDVDIASEFRYREPILKPDHLVIVISQSGETADTIAALREAKRQGVKTLAIVNVVGSTVAREADHVMYTLAGPEIAVATTKAYTAQIMALVVLSSYLAQEKGLLSQEESKRLIQGLAALPLAAQAVLAEHHHLQRLASRFFNHRNVFFIGRGIDYSLSLEGSLKLKEISYIHSEAQAAGELKHGTISLIEQGTLVIALATQQKLRDKMLSNIREVQARGAVVLAVGLEGDLPLTQTAQDSVLLPYLADELQPILSIFPLQLFAYYVAALNGHDVDKPRNLAKSVTVE